MKDAELSKTAARYAKHYEEYIKSGLTSAEYCAQHNIDLKVWNVAITRMKQRGQLPQDVAHGHVKLQHKSDCIGALNEDLQNDRDMLIRFYASGKSSEEWCTDNGLAPDTIDKCKQRLLDNGIVCDRVDASDMQELSKFQCQVIEVYKQHYETGVSIFECCAKKGLNIIDVITEAAEMNQNGILPIAYADNADLSQQEMDAIRLYMEHQETGLSFRRCCEGKNINYNTIRYYIPRLRKKGILDSQEGKSQSAESQLALFQDFKNSGLTKAEWCRRNNIPYSTLRSIERRMPEADSSDVTSELSGFHRVVCEIYKQHYETGIPVGELCTQYGLSKSSVMSTASRLRKKGILLKQRIGEEDTGFVAPGHFDEAEVCGTIAEKTIDYKALEKPICEKDARAPRVVSTLRYGKISVDIREGISEQTLQIIIKALLECTRI